MNDMTKILNCELCGSDEMMKHKCYFTDELLVLDDTEMDLGILGTGIMQFGIGIMDDDYSLLSRVKFNGVKSKYSNKIKIKYCPFCGRELE